MLWKSTASTTMIRAHSQGKPLCKEICHSLDLMSLILRSPFFIDTEPGDGINMLTANDQSALSYCLYVGVCRGSEVV